MKYKGFQIPPDLQREIIGIFREKPVFLRIGTVLRVDYENMVLDIRYEDQPGGRVSIPISTAGGSQRALSMTVPEENSIVVLGFTRYHKNFRRPFIVAVLPAAYRSKINFSPYKSQPEGDPKLRRFRGRKLYPGDAYMSSTQGSEIHLDHNILVEDMSFDTFKLREEDGAVIFRSLQTYTADASKRMWSGLATRNDFEILEPGNEDREEGLEGEQGEIVKSGYKYIRTSTGRKFVHVTQKGKTIDDGDKAFTETRFSLEECSLGVRPVTQELHDFDFQITNPVWRDDSHQLMEISFGTLIGDDPIYEKDRYGKILEPELLQKEYYFEADEGDKDKPNVHEKVYKEGVGWQDACTEYLNEKPLSIKDDLDRKLKTAAAFRFRMRNTKSHFTWISMTKEGKLLAHLGMSSELDSLGEGRSAELVTEGSIKLVSGRNKLQHHSLIYALRGSVVGHIGSTDPIFNERKRHKALYRDKKFYGEHGYHDLQKLSLRAPIQPNTANSNPGSEALSVDVVIDRNMHFIIGSDYAVGGVLNDKKSVTVDTEGSLVFALGADVTGHSIVLQGDGSFEGQLGKNHPDQRSINLDCMGGVQIHVDDGDIHKGQSLHMELAKGVEIRINDVDDDGYALRMDIRGNVKIRMHGEKVELSVAATEEVIESVQSPKITRTLSGDVTEFIIGNYKQVVVGNREMFTTGTKVYS